MNIFNVFLYNILREKYKKYYSLFGSLERERSRGDGRRVKGNDYPSHYLDAFKISKEEESN